MRLLIVAVDADVAIPASAFRLEGFAGRLAAIECIHVPDDSDYAPILEAAADAVGALERALAQERGLYPRR
jgi:hypothetical protein